MWVSLSIDLRLMIRGGAFGENLLRFLSSAPSRD